MKDLEETSLILNFLVILMIGGLQIAAAYVYVIDHDWQLAVLMLLLAISLRGKK